MQWRFYGRAGGGKLFFQNYRSSPVDLPPELVDETESNVESEGPVSVATGGGASELIGQPLSKVERWVIEETLRLTGDNREEAAKILGIGARALYRGLDQNRKEDEEAMASAGGGGSNQDSGRSHQERSFCRLMLSSLRRSGDARSAENTRSETPPAMTAQDDAMGTPSRGLPATASPDRPSPTASATVSR